VFHRKMDPARRSVRLSEEVKAIEFQGMKLTPLARTTNRSQTEITPLPVPFPTTFSLVVG
jgi:hypothetical protein